MSETLIDLLKTLLHKNPAKRMSRGKTDLIKNHPWCKSIDWDKALRKNLVPPFKPSMNSSNFDPEYVRDSSVRTT
jgi:hypothetical protein